MLPISDGPSPRRGIPWVTWGLILINVIIFLFELSLGSGLDSFIRNYGTVPREILTGQDVPPPGPYPLWIQLITSMFLHGGWLHIIGNMIYLWVFGDDVEYSLGHLPYLVFYLVVGIFANLVQVYFSGPTVTTPSIGASGAIAGVLGAYLVLFPMRPVRVIFPVLLFFTARVSALIVLGFWFVLQFFNGITALSQGTANAAGVAVWAHIGGFAVGMFVGLLVRILAGTRQRSYGRIWNE